MSSEPTERLQVELLGFGTVYNRFVTEKSDRPEVKATHIRTIVPILTFYTTILNGCDAARCWAKTSLLKVTILGTPVEGGSDYRSPDEIIVTFGLTQK